MKRLPVLIFVAVALVQLYIPAQMIMGREKVISEGEALKFKLVPIDPHDHFRGKYIILNYDQVVVPIVDKNDNFVYDEVVYVTLQKDKAGYVLPQKAYSEPPASGVFVKARIINWSSRNNNWEVTVEFPFDRFYMEESKAYQAEVAYRNSISDTSATAYALVHVLNGEAVVTEVFLDDVPILEVLRNK